VSVPAAKLILIVRGGLAPTPTLMLPELERRWWLPHEPAVDAGERARVEQEADEYAARLRDPARVNYVVTEWVWT
jgi:hypothetical protein